MRVFTKTVAKVDMSHLRRARSYEFIFCKSETFEKVSKYCEPESTVARVDKELTPRSFELKI